MQGRNNLNKSDSEIFNIVYPIGSIYMSVNNISPSILFGGTWEQIKDRFLLGAGDTYKVGEVGGEATHILTLDEIPEHSHVQSVAIAGVGTNYAYTNMISENNYTNTYSRSENSGLRTHDAGEGEAHNNMPPYLTVYMWKRTV